jgi:hypothetical protein
MLTCLSTQKVGNAYLFFDSSAGMTEQGANRAHKKAARRRRLTWKPFRRDKGGMLGDLDWHRFANGDFETPVAACRLHIDFVRALGATNDRLLIHPSVVPKLVVKHSLTPWHFALLPLMTEFGSVFRDRDGSLIFAYEETVITGKMFIAVVKTTTERHELWLRTLYEIRNRHYEKKRKRSTILRIQQ